MAEETNIDADAYILNGRAKFIMKKYSGSAIGLTVITGNHLSIIGKPFKYVTNQIKDSLDFNHEYDKDVIVEEDVWIGANVTILAGVTIGRGCVVGSGAVVRKSTPPYSMVLGNPARIIGFKFSPEEIIEHEKMIYKREERLDIQIIENNFNKYYIDRIKDIRSFLKQ